jgi:hypothetical protein
MAAGSDDKSVGAPRSVDATKPVDPTAAVDALEGVEATASVQALDSAKAVRGSDAVSEVAALLRAGQLTVDQAVDRLIDDAVNKQVGRAIEPGSEVEARLRRVLRDYAGADPLISAKISRLHGRRPAK